MAADIEHLDAMINRLEAEARDRWGENWRIDVTRWTDETVDVMAVHRNGVLTDHSSDEKLHEVERLHADAEGRIAYERVHLREQEVVDRCEDRLIADSVSESAEPPKK